MQQICAELLLEEHRAGPGRKIITVIVESMLLPGDACILGGVVVEGLLELGMCRRWSLGKVGQ